VDNLKQSMQQQLRVLCDAGDKELRIDKDNHFNDSQQTDGNIETS